MLKYYHRYTSGATSTLTTSSSPPLLFLSLPSNYYNLSYTTTTLRICFFSIRITALKFGFQEVRRSTHCRARRRVVRYNDEDEDDDDEEFEYGHNAEIAMLELYSQSARDEALLVTASVDDQDALVLIFKGFSSCLSYKTSPDPSRSVLPKRAVIKSIDRIRGPFDPSNIEYLEQGLTWETFKTRLHPN
ncbi:uncharacterized protein LOC114272839 [Camellia sinensis]|uniref:uncharacterized protein LOC114272838 n=1 Tax=Camellia sinensis TaxID=4442 RepID=UPI0010365DB2|nr:uncharacterized protein LOC114272838 [Camellia sinensis]XP_028070341.1 uncharacterized protein LOC114272839 [Camellia sinensis]